jgi:hypothetical protein
VLGDEQQAVPITHQLADDGRFVVGAFVPGALRGLDRRGQKVTMDGVISTETFPTRWRGTDGQIRSDGSRMPVEGALLDARRTRRDGMPPVSVERRRPGKGPYRRGDDHVCFDVSCRRRG